MAPPQRHRQGSDLEGYFAKQLQLAGIGDYVREHRFALSIGRNWAFDFAWPKRKLAVEIEGGTHKKGRHTSSTGFREDCHKYNTAAMLGWTLLRGDSEMVRNRLLITYVRDSIDGRPPSLRRTKFGRLEKYVIDPSLDPWSPSISYPPNLAPRTPRSGRTSSGNDSEGTP